MLTALLNKPKRTNTENYLRELKAARLSLNKVRKIKLRELKAARTSLNHVHEIKLREFKAEQKLVQREY